ncbi:unnamed protein product [Pleuronectes platessa]|uniref:EF-hand domain-containing protein n=1 Tax=Pleuronectes platessa TaxID=8262 RepID=A0A9N7TP26_PLEPL|nr:unnamed protein product [Pleuronectes platessa]
MITMCLQSAKHKHLRVQQQQPSSDGQGLGIFHDIFRRADKNDDGKLSFEEFNTYFADGILTTEELQELFFSIDGRQSNNLDTVKLSDYFSQHLGEYLNVLSALESLNGAILKAMDKTKELLLGDPEAFQGLMGREVPPASSESPPSWGSNPPPGLILGCADFPPDSFRLGCKPAQRALGVTEYQGSSVLGQFVTRFMLRETSSQLLSLQRSLQCAMEAVEEQSSPAPGFMAVAVAFGFQAVLSMRTSQQCTPSALSA